MFNKSVLLGLLAAAASVSARTVGPLNRGCATPDPDEADLANTAALIELEQSAARSGNMSMFANPVVIPTYFHVVASSQSVANGYISDSMINDQLDVMNQDFAPHGISFDLQGTTRTINPTWAQDGNEMAMKRELRQGGYNALNLYFVRTLGGPFGYCYFPTSNASPGSTAFIRDGCTILSSTVPGGSSTNYNLGKTATHEVGHWLNLYHTFQGSGCSEPGDYVDDTPTQASASSGCPIGRNSCPNLPGVDPIHNYMDYSNDPCYEEFTAGQGTRMNNAWSQFRA